MTPCDTSVALRMPPESLLDGASLFIDFDGTLVELARHPDGVAVTDTLRALLARLHARHSGRVAIVSGRSIAQLDALLGPVARLIALSGSHGCEHRWDGISAHPIVPPSLEHVAVAMRDFAAVRPGMLVEEKSFGVALHYRGAPDAEEEACRLAIALAAEYALVAQHGKMVIEVRPPGSDKGVPVRRLMARARMAGTRPIFLGDDLTDEAGFHAAQKLGGAGVLVGPPRPTIARYRLPEPAAARDWLEAGRSAC